MYLYGKPRHKKYVTLHHVHAGKNKTLDFSHVNQPINKRSSIKLIPSK